ncbi:flavin reductase family protein [Streptomyces albireticuli]|uniref:Flavin reductase n=1 Tax=Streptomyces albireticuli TaxID=1940 RepID=A0A2A2D355_9ACTN|nr:flavin reductase family protein [Streptomyces albireticuli]MCD9144908.1 flavin reductase family protein [Streptomyces albireticuli]MCD9164334.1 flavin reductase family protein [Streptomyces albireticuli]MCD9194045.1 flavin reductase family protein [Streptomyces albireticuli]PAU45941.1 flavin reductase [Streptomyces albireticuli]
MAAVTGATGSIEQDFRDAMAGVCAPVTIVTATQDGVPYGATVSAFTSLSLHPAMVSVALDRSSDVLARILATGRFGVNVLGHDQDDLARTFARRVPDRFTASGAPWHYDHGLPRLTGAPGWLVCELGSAVEGGDHLLLLGDVGHVRTAEAAPLVYGYRTFGTHSAFAR